MDFVRVLVVPGLSWSGFSGHLSSRFLWGLCWAGSAGSLLGWLRGCSLSLGVNLLCLRCWRVDII